MRTTLAVLLWLAVAAPATAATGTLRGTIHRGPIQPVCRVGTPCTAPSRGVTILLTRAGTTRRVTTDEAGRYRVVLGAGTWSVALPGRGAGTSIAPTRVSVRADATRRVDLTIDTGIR